MAMLDALTKALDLIWHDDDVLDLFLQFRPPPGQFPGQFPPRPYQGQPGQYQGPPQ